MEEIDISKDMFYTNDSTINTLAHVYAKLSQIEDKNAEQDFVNKHMAVCKNLEVVYKIPDKTIKTFTLIRMSPILLKITSEALKKIKQDPTQIVQILFDDEVKLSCVTVPKLVGDLNYNQKGQFAGIPGAQNISLLRSGIYAPVSQIESLVRNKTIRDELAIDAKTAEEIAKPIIKYMANKKEIQLLVKDRKIRNIKTIKYTTYTNFMIKENLARNFDKIQVALANKDYQKANSIVDNSTACNQLREKVNGIYQNRVIGLNVIKDYEYELMPATLDKYLLTR